MTLLYEKQSQTKEERVDYSIHFSPSRGKFFLSYHIHAHIKTKFPNKLKYKMWEMELEDFLKEILKHIYDLEVRLLMHKNCRL